jgi:hypothetical protein
MFSHAASIELNFVQDNLRRRFSTAYHWYLVLTITVAEHVSDLVGFQMPSPNAEDGNASDRERTQPSEYLRSRCPLCFGGTDWRRDHDAANECVFYLFNNTSYS